MISDTLLVYLCSIKEGTYEDTMLLNKHFYECSSSHVMLCFLLRTRFSKNVRTWDLKHCSIHHLNTLSGVV